MIAKALFANHIESGRSQSTLFCEASVFVEDHLFRGDKYMLKQLPLRLFLIQLVLCQLVFGQLTLSTIRGVAQDRSGAVIGGASIRVTSVDTNATREVKTGESGDFEIPDLPRGTYRLTATAVGFKTFIAGDIILESPNINNLIPSNSLRSILRLSSWSPAMTV